MTAMRLPCCSDRMRFRSVVLPEPKKPVSTVTGIRLASLTPDTSHDRQGRTHAKSLRTVRKDRGRGNRLKDTAVAGLSCRPHRPKSQATHRSPTAMFASLQVSGRSPDSRAHENHAGESPSHVDH